MSAPPRRLMVSSAEAQPAKGQHTKPCSDCPWRRDSLEGWLGGLTTGEWLNEAHGEGSISCHTLQGAQCAGSAIYRANVCKLPRLAAALRLPPDREHVFANRFEFIEHHVRIPKRSAK